MWDNLDANRFFIRCEHEGIWTSTIFLEWYSWIETSGSLGLDINAEQVANPRGFKSHLSFDRIPKGCKYINVIRDPLDAAYSSFKFMEGWYLEPGAVSPDDFVSQSLKRGDYYHHFISWWPQRNNKNVLYLVYEDMKKYLSSNIKKISKFAVK